MLRGSEDIFEKVNFGPKTWPFDPRARVFLRITYTSFEMPYYCLTSCKKSKNSGAQFESNLWKSPILDLIWPFDPTHRGSRVFFENRKTSHFYIYAVLTLCKISKTSGADSKISALRTTDEAEFIGPFQLKPWVQKTCTSVSLHLTEAAVQKQLPEVFYKKSCS